MTRRVRAVRWDAAIVAVLLVAIVWWWAAGRPRALGPAVNEAGPVVVMSMSGAIGAKDARRYVHTVRAGDGAEYQMMFGEMFPKGSRIWVNYHRYTATNRVDVSFYYLCTTKC